jgi:16S rRNA (adenine1518-N6/adenine1519-N6)-dimethyltransferase
LSSSTIKRAHAHQTQARTELPRRHEAVERIAASLGDLSGRTVVEIGPGAAPLQKPWPQEPPVCLPSSWTTTSPCNCACSFRRSASRRRAGCAAIRFCDSLGGACERLLVVGNLPYGITSQILLKLAASHASLDRAVLMVQREVADRVTAQPGSRDYGLLSVTVQMYGAAEQLFTLPPEAFSPPPDVHSTVFRWRFAPRFAELGVEEASFLRFVRKAFAQKRKTLANNLRAAGIPPAAVAESLAEAGLTPLDRAEALSVESFATLWRCLETEGDASTSD